MLFMSKTPGYIYDVRGPVYNTNVPYGMLPIQERPGLVADFGGAYGSALMTPEWDDEDGNTHADIRGGVFDTDEAARRLGWTEDEKRMVEEKMLRQLADPRFVDFWLYEEVKPSAPWPTYDDAHHFKIPALAAELGLVREALAYEEATKGRESVVAALREKLGEAAVEESLTAA